MGVPCKDSLPFLGFALTLEKNEEVELVSELWGSQECYGTKQKFI